MKEKEKLQKRIAEIENQLADMEAKMEALMDQQYELEQELWIIERDEKIKALLNSIYTVCPENAQGIQLFNDTKTTPIMDSFYDSSKQFLIIHRAFLLSPGWRYVGLVISKSVLGIDYLGSKLTMTDLKKAVGECVSNKSPFYINAKSRKHYLYRSLIDVAPKMCEKGQLIPFEKPCLLGGQTFRNQQGYGSRYCGEELVHEGTEYGETTRFLIIGILVED